MRERERCKMCLCGDATDETVKHTQHEKWIDIYKKWWNGSAWPAYVWMSRVCELTSTITETKSYMYCDRYVFGQWITEKDSNKKKKNN